MTFAFDASLVMTGGALGAASFHVDLTLTPADATVATSGSAAFAFALDIAPAHGYVSPRDLSFPFGLEFFPGGGNVTGHGAARFAFDLGFSLKRQGGDGVAAFAFDLGFSPVGSVNAVGTVSFPFDVTLPMRGVAAVVGAGIAWVTNLRQKGVSKYTAFPYNSFCYFNGVYLGADETHGICRLDAATEQEAPIAMSLTLGAIDAGAIANVPQVYVELDGVGELELTAGIPGPDDDTLTIASTDTVDVSARGLHPERFRLAKGIRGREWTIALNNVAGSAITIQDMEIDILKSSRRA
jgi:hypothetical protein